MVASADAESQVLLFHLGFLRLGPVVVRQGRGLVPSVSSGAEEEPATTLLSSRLHGLSKKGPSQRITRASAWKSLLYLSTEPLQPSGHA